MQLNQEKNTNIPDEGIDASDCRRELQFAADSQFKQEICHVKGMIFSVQSLATRSTRE